MLSLPRTMAAAAVVLLAAAPIVAVAAPAVAVPLPTVNITEVQASDPAGGSDWIEVHNTGSATVDISGLYLRDDGTKNFVLIPAGTTLAVDEYRAFDINGLGASGDSARLMSADNTIIDSFTWDASNPAPDTSFGRCPDPTGAFVRTAAITKGAANSCASSTGSPTPTPTQTVTVSPTPTDTATPTSQVVINEVEQSGGTPGDWIELRNNGITTFDLSGYILRDNNDGHTFLIPQGTTVAAGAYATFDVDIDPNNSFGLGASGDSARLFAPDGTTLLDQTTWTSDPGTTWGRCADGTGAFRATGSSTKGAANDCSPAPTPAPTGSGTPTGTPTPPAGELVWPGSATVANADNGEFVTNMSGLIYEAGASAAQDEVWAVKNGPGTLYQLTSQGSNWSAPAGDWATGRVLHFPGQPSSNVDAEGVTLTGAGAAGGVYVSTERDNNLGSVNRHSVLKFDVSSAGSGDLTATQEWNLTADLPTTPSNKGLEGVAWVPDSYLTGTGFVDATTGAAYNPANYPGHGNGLFFVGLEGTGGVYAYALMDDGTFHKLATFSSGVSTVMELSWDADQQALWVVCDSTCQGRYALFRVAQSGDAKGQFVSDAVYAQPSGIPAGSAGTADDEGFTFAPNTRCVNGEKTVLFSDDANALGHSIRTGTITCAALAVSTTGPTTSPEPTATADPTSTPGPTGTTAPTSAPAAPDESALTDAARGGVTAPGTVTAGGSATISVGASHAGETVEAFIFSTPVDLGAHVVAADGTITVSIPTTLAAGSHRIAIVGADGTLIGWAPVELRTSALASTGSDPAPMLLLAGSLLLAGAGFLGLRRALRMRRAA